MPGDTIGVIAPAGAVDRAALETGCSHLRALGYPTVYLDSICDQDQYFAGSVDRRVNEIHEMFRRSEVKGIVAAWYPGQAGGQAIAEILTGQVNPSGHLPVSFPVSTADLPRPDPPGFGTPEQDPITVDYFEGADVGYRWFAKQGRAPLYPFGYGLSYTHFSYSDLHLHGKSDITATFTVRNEGDRPGADIPQLYLTSIGGAKTLRLLGFRRVSLSPGESQQVELHIDSRLLASFDSRAKQWRIASGRYEISLARYAGAAGESAAVSLPARLFGR